MAIFKYLIVFVLDKEHDSTSSNRFGEMAVNVKDSNHVLSTGDGCKSDRRTLIFWYLHDGIRLRIGPILPISSYLRYKNGFLGILSYSTVRHSLQNLFLPQPLLCICCWYPLSGSYLCITLLPSSLATENWRTRVQRHLSEPRFICRTNRYFHHINNFSSKTITQRF